MAIVTVEQKEANRDTPSDPGGSSSSLRGLQAQLLQWVSSTPDKLELLQRFALLIAEQAKTEAVFYFERNDRGELTRRHQLLPVDETQQSQRLAKQLASACQAACTRGEIEERRQASPARVILGAPVAVRGRPPEALGVVFSATDTPPAQNLFVQMLSSHLVLWHVLSESRDAESEAHHSAALLELIEQLETAPDLSHAFHRLVGELQEYLQCRRVALGVRRSNQGRCRLAAISGVARFDRRSGMVQSIEAALDEAVLRDEVTVWPPLSEEARHGLLAHKNVCTADDAKCAISIPLRCGERPATGALLLLDDTTERLPAAESFLRGGQRSLATSLQIVRSAEGNRLVRLGRAVRKGCGLWKGRIVIALCVLALATMAIPLPYKIKCNCQMEPVTRRFVAAPFEGTLDKAFVRPGDIVRHDDLLARMDGREIRWERAGVEADRQQAVKRRDAAQATHQYAEAQIASLEMQRLELRLRLLDHRARNLEIRSPVAGVVASGDLERAEGAPLSVGQTLFEIAPLRKMVVEVAIDDEEVARARPGQTIAVRLDAFPGETWHARITKIHPRSEIRDEENVFLAEAVIANDDGRLRPGMKGRAKIVTPRRPLGWILFHKPWEYVTKKLKW